jgi:hypothetical protein
MQPRALLWLQRQISAARMAKSDLTVLWDPDKRRDSIIAFAQDPTLTRLKIPSKNVVSWLAAYTKASSSLSHTFI